MIKGIIFDLDGTIIHTLPELAYCVNYALEKVGLPQYSEEKIKTFVGDGMISLIKNAVQNHVKDLSENELKKIEEECFQIFWKEYEINCINSQFYLGVDSFLIENSNFNFAILTNKSEYFTLKIIDHLGVRKYFSHILTGDNPEYKKPQIGGIQKILSDWNFKNEEVVLVGDHKTDLEAAEKANITSVFAKYGYGIKGDFKPKYTINEFQNLKQLIKILNS